MKRLLFVLTAMLGLCLAPAAHAAGMALIVANSKYQKAPPLPAVPASAEALRKTLEAAGYGVTVVNDYDNASLLGDYFDFLAGTSDLGKGDVILVYYLGYAAQHDKHNFFMGVDGDPSNPDQIEQLGFLLDPSSAEKQGANEPAFIYVVDAASTGEWGKAKGARGLASVKPGPGDIFAFAAEPGTVAAEVKGDLTPYTEAFIASLVPDVSADDLFRDVRRRVTDATSGRQQSWFRTGVAEPVKLFQDGGSTSEAGAHPPPKKPDAEVPGSTPGSALPGTSAPGGGSDSLDDLLGEGSSAGDPLNNLGETLGSAGPQTDPGDIAGSPPPDTGQSLDLGGDFAGAMPGGAAPGGAMPGTDFEGSSLGSPSGGGETAGAPPPVEEPKPAPPPATGSDAMTAQWRQLIGAMGEDNGWNLVQASQDPAAFAAFVQLFPQSRHLAPAAGEEQSAGGDAGEPRGTEAEPETPVTASPDPSTPVTPGAVAGATPPDEDMTRASYTETELERHPTLDAPETVAASEVFTVSVALTEEQITPDVAVKAGPTTKVTEEGALSFSLPADKEEWPIDIDLLAAGFDLADGGKWSRQVTLYKVGDSDFARFEVKARPIKEDAKQRQVMARLYHEGRFLGSVSRPVLVLHEGQSVEAASQLSTASARTTALAAPSLASEVLIGSEEVDVPDLDVTVHYADPDNLGDGLIVIHSPHLPGPVSAEFTTPAGMTEWLDNGYARLVSLGLQLRGAKSLTETEQPQDPESQRRFIAKVAEGLGDDLYRNYVPQAFKDVFWSLKDRGVLHSIQITSNSPVLPWELVRPQKAPGGVPDGFLGINYRMARWAPRSEVGQVDQPLDHLAFTGVAAVAPPYENNRELPFQQVEIDALSKLNGFRLIGGDFNAFEKMVGEVSSGFIHFSGHGEVNDPGDGRPVFAIRLTDQSLDPNTWRALKFAPHDKGNPFYFFNACDTGRAASLGGFVQGWGPAVLATGASGFIGGMWPLADRSAADFSTEFYGEVASNLSRGPVYLAGVLQDVRKRFYDTGDPTYLAYTFYGNANLQVVAQ